MPEAMPRSVLIVGAGAIGIEFASFFRQMGAEVTVVEALERILPVEDEEISALAAKAFAGQGIRLRTGARLASVARTADGIAATVATPEGEERVLAERLVSAVGITGNVEDLGLEGRRRARGEGGTSSATAWGGTGVAGLWGRRRRRRATVARPQGQPLKASWLWNGPPGSTRVRWTAPPSRTARTRRRRSPASLVGGYGAPERPRRAYWAVPVCGERQGAGPR